MTLSMTFGWGHTDGEIRPIKDNGTEKAAGTANLYVLHSNFVSDMVAILNMSKGKWIEWYV